MALTFKEEVSKITRDAQGKLLSEKYDTDYWKYQACLGTHFVAQYYLLSRWLGAPLGKFNVESFKKIIFSRQKSDGSWLQWPDLNIKSGDLDATIIHYFALKVMGENLSSPVMSKARDFVLGRGGIEKGSLFIQVIMALFGNLPWKNVPSIPYLIFIEGMPCNYKSFSHWSKPHVMAFSYLRRLRVQKDLGELFRVDELRTTAKTNSFDKRRTPISLIDGPVVEKIRSMQLAHGSWNGYTTSTLFSVVALSDYESFNPKRNPKLPSAISKGLKFLEDLYLDERANAYLGVSCDGRNWDTILVSSALLEGGMNVKDLLPFLNFTKNVQNSEGGIGYGIDFDVGPDVDDTAEAIKLWAAADVFPEETRLGAQWLLKHQNSVGGWGAFDKDNESSALMKLVTKGFEDFDSLFDFPSADCTGHALEALAASGLASEHSSAVQKGVSFLKRTQNKKSGSWSARWAVNHIFGTFVALSGLVKVGEDVQAPYIQKALNWLAQIQNNDGGFGESTDSYIDSQCIGKGASTPSQTAWAILTLMECDFEKYKSIILKGARYLVETYKDDQLWSDPCAVGTGHPGSVYMQYNSYAKAFPLLALAKLAKRL